MQQTAIPFLFMRGGTSRGAYLRRADLPEDLDTLTRVLIAAVGAGHPINIDGIGGGSAVTTKVVMLSPSTRDDADIDYFFAQVAVEEPLVDYKPTCGNMLSGVANAAVELGLCVAQDPHTRVRIHAVNTGALVHAVIQTPGGVPDYEGQTAIDGVPGTAASVSLTFMHAMSSVSGALLPTGSARDTIDGIEISCIDAAVPMAIARASDFGLTGYESCEALDANREFFARMEPIRVAAGERMGLGEVSSSVTPKFALLAPARRGGAVAVRYFMPWTCHPSMAVTGSACLAACLFTPGTVAEGLATLPAKAPAVVGIEHPSGQIDLTVDYAQTAAGPELRAVGLIRTARLLARGELMIPGSVWRPPPFAA
ncbi:4-oxalomesaconate tautomerase [Enhygromyxa salina]|uniref:4-oxalomesaconate tautomerase n=1 Tax=Enhygromyxa salina TaxID=215803 RepID=A0A2S9YEC4_9BACT|nr:4-oxalomesaconate tautomerase [Enhygromyxa salina]PRQ03361.1 4-oxalomesaconate tautomerase [Enhygromyxa salina]